MSTVGQRERAVQDRVVHLLRDNLGSRYFGDRKDRAGNSAIEEPLLTRRAPLA